MAGGLAKDGEWISGQGLDKRCKLLKRKKTNLNGKDTRVGEEEYLGLSDAAKYLGVSRVTVWRLVREGSLAVYQTGASKRKKLVRKSDLEGLRRPRRVKRST